MSILPFKTGLLSGYFILLITRERFKFTTLSLLFNRSIIHMNKSMHSLFYSYMKLMKIRTWWIPFLKSKWHTTLSVSSTDLLNSNVHLKIFSSPRCTTHGIILQISPRKYEWSHRRGDGMPWLRRYRRSKLAFPDTIFGSILRRLKLLKP